MKIKAMLAKHLGNLLKPYLNTINDYNMVNINETHHLCVSLLEYLSPEVLIPQTFPQIIFNIVF